MKFFVYDTETTGLDTRKAMILQLSGIYLEIENRQVKCMEIVNRYFATDTEVPNDASRVHGLTRVDLNNLSGGLFFEDSYAFFKKYFEDEDIVAVGFNSIHFDRPLLKSNCTRYDVKCPVWKDEIDIMRAIVPFVKVNNYGRISLRDALYQVYVRDGSMTNEGIEKMFYNTCKNHIVRDNKFHDALWDSYVTMLLLLYLIKEGAVST